VKFWLGVHRAHWLRETAVPLFVSRRVLANRKTMPVALGQWALDSGGFSELSLFGEWTVSASTYVDEVWRFTRDIGGLAWAAAQDWMCEPFILRRTGLSVAVHQERTVANYLELQMRAPELPWVPVVQGWQDEDYFRHVDCYGRAGVDLTALPLVGIGTVCRRQSTTGVFRIVSQLASAGLRLHGFGVKTLGLPHLQAVLHSADSMAWSFRARKRGFPLPGCPHRNCANCLRFALLWREQLLGRVRRMRREEDS
jgi:hypothetical protein